MESDIMNKKDMPECPIETALMLFGEKWKFLILRELLMGPKRFKHLTAAINKISDRMLTVKLEALIKEGLVSKTIYTQGPHRIEYDLTDLGRTLTTVFESLYDWGEMYQTLVNTDQLTIEDE